MKILGLDLSTKTGFGLVDSRGQLLSFGQITERKLVQDSLLCDEYQMLARAEALASLVIEDAVKPNRPDAIFIEQTNLGSKRETQKLLEFIHCVILIQLKKEGLDKAVYYVDTSRWKSALGIKMTKEDREHNKLVKAKKARGKITSKHLSVRWANNFYNLELKLKDNDMADAIAMATFGLKHLSARRSPDQSSESYILDALRLSE